MYLGVIRWFLGIGANCMENTDTGVSPNTQDHFPLIHLGRVLVFVAAQGRNTSFFVSSNVEYVLGQQHVVYPYKTIKFL